MISRMFKTIGNQRYEYKPRYYDPDKEVLQERIKLRERVKAGDKVAIKQSMRNSMRRNRDKKETSDYIAKSNVTILVVFTALLLIAVLALNMYLPEFLEVVLGQ
ncbi:MAG: hypothetical protein AB8G11_20270 [Saprospiraceae bacterium]